jgi:hypothetical protein
LLTRALVQIDGLFVPQERAAAALFVFQRGFLRFQLIDELGDVRLIHDPASVESIRFDEGGAPGQTGARVRRRFYRKERRGPRISALAALAYGTRRAFEPSNGARLSRRTVLFYVARAHRCGEIAPAPCGASRTEAAQAAQAAPKPHPLDRFTFRFPLIPMPEVTFGGAFV